MTRALWILAVVTLAAQLALRVFAGVIERALAAAGWGVLLLGIMLPLTMDVLLVVPVITGVYVAGKAHRGGWVALFCVVALVLGIYGPYAAGFAVAVPSVVGTGYVFATFYELLGLVLEALVPLVALAYTLRYRRARNVPVLTRADGG